jgi:hypothetical protein
MPAGKPSEDDSGGTNTRHEIRDSLRLGRMNQALIIHGQRSQATRDEICYRLLFLVYPLTNREMDCINQAIWKLFIPAQNMLVASSLCDCRGFEKIYL